MSKISDIPKKIENSKSFGSFLEILIIYGMSLRFFRKLLNFQIFLCFFIENLQNIDKNARYLKNAKKIVHKFCLHNRKFYF